jgi:hypothetical protein
MELPPPPTMAEPPLHQPTPEDEDIDFDQGDSKVLDGRATKETEQIRFIENAKLEDVLVDDQNAIQVGRTANETTFMQSIKGCSPKMLSSKCLRKFCILHHISGYKNKPKTILCNLIVQRVKMMVLDAGLYPEDFKANNKEKGENKSKKKLSRNAKPPAVTKDGSYWRVIATYFLESMRPHVIKLGNNPDVQSVDSRKFLHEDIWSILAEEYNKQDHPNLRTFLRDDNFYELARIPEDIPSTFDTLTPIELSQLVSHINYYYKKAIRSQRGSGSHYPITKYIGTRPWLLLYHKSLRESSIEIKALVSGDLPKGVGGTSLMNGEEDDTDSDADTKPRKRKYSPRRGKGGKEVQAEIESSEKARVATAMEEVSAVSSFVLSRSLFCSLSYLSLCRLPRSERF